MLPGADSLADAGAGTDVYRGARQCRLARIRAMLSESASGQLTVPNRYRKRREVMNVKHPYVRFIRRRNIRCWKTSALRCNRGKCSGSVARRIGKVPFFRCSSVTLM